MNAEQLKAMNDLLESDNDLRDKIRGYVSDFDSKTRTIVGTLNRIHSVPSDEIAQLICVIRPMLEGCQDVAASLANIIPPNQFWRYKDMWATSLRNAVFAAVLVEYLTARRLLPLDAAKEALGIKEDWIDRFTLVAEDYLHGVINAVNELSRLAVNAVTMGDYTEPIRISVFVKDVFAGFTMLNLKNDTLRRRYDSLKYDIKKVEEVVYDVCLRNLAGRKGSDV